MDHSRSDEPQDPRPIVVTGASGFVGRHVVTALKASGVRFVCGTRDPERQRERDPSVLWRRIDLEEPETVRPALEGCRALVHLVHQIDAGSDYPEREERGARCIAEAAAAADLDRVVFLGGPDPGPNGSKHLHSRLRSGELLRQGDVPAVELRAAMIIGPGGISWDMVRGLAKKLPAMVLPRWAENHSWPVDIDDVVAAVMAALHIPLSSGADESGVHSAAAEGGGYVFDVPGPERLSHREVLERVSSALGKAPPMLDVPVLSPKLSSYWIRLITGIDLHMTQQLVAGVSVDLDPKNALIWARTPRVAPSFAATVSRTLDDERINEHSGRLISAARQQRLETLGRQWADATLGEHGPLPSAANDA